MKLKKTVLAWSLLFIFALSLASWATTFHVNTTNEFQGALNTAAANGENDTIYVTAGTYDITSTLTFFSGENHSLIIVGAESGTVILDGGNTTQILSLMTTEASAALSIKKMIFRKGKSGDNGGALEIQTTAAYVTIENCEFRDNVAMLVGGGVHVISNYGIVSISNSSFMRNSAVEDAGGLNVGTTDGSIVITNSIFEDNTVPGVHPGVPAKDGGGAILYVDGTGQVTMTGNTFNRNSAADGGGGCMTYFLGSGVSLTMDHNNFSNNHAQLDGGGCFTRINDSGTITFNNNTFTGNSTVTAGGAGSMIHLNAGTLNYAGNTYTNNTAGEDGGGSWIWNGTGTMTITGNTFCHNRAANNGGGAFLSTDAGTMTVSKNVFNANTAGNVGGGLSYATGNGQLSLYNNTFYGNQAVEGGGVYLYFDQSGATSTVSNNILWHDIPNGLAMSGATSTTATYSDIEHGMGAPWFGTECMDINPLFADPASGDFHLTSTSPCIDAGNPDLDHDGLTWQNDTDDRDPDGTRMDLGAYYCHRSTGIVIVKEHVPIRIYLYQNYPNPFNPSTMILFSIPHREHVTLKIIDVLGREITTLINDKLDAGDHSVIFDAKNLPSGMYFYRLMTPTFSQTQTMEVIK